MPPNVYGKPLGIFAALLGIIQGLAWFLMSLVGILIYFKVWVPREKFETYNDYLNIALLYGYVNSDYGTIDGVIIGPKEMFICFWIYLTLSIIWLLWSKVLLWMLLRNKFDNIKMGYYAWSGITIIISGCDLALMGLLAHDYVKYEDLINEKLLTVTGGEITDINGPLSLAVTLTVCEWVIALAAKGFVLWIVNVVFALVLTKTACRLPKQHTDHNLNSAPILAYEQPKDIIPWIPANALEGISNPAYDEQSDKPDFTRSNSFTTPGNHSQLVFEERPGFKSLPRVYAAANYSPYARPISNGVADPQVAKIGPQSKSLPLVNIPPPKVPGSNFFFKLQPPRIPSPDYSPPNSPRGLPLKSVLKTRPVSDSRSKRYI